jgi:hypothetical protein
MAEKIVEMQDIINIKDLPREIKEGDVFVLVFDGIRNGKMYFAFKNIGKPIEELPL